VETLEFTLLKAFTSCRLDCRVILVTGLTVATTGTATKIDGLFATVIALIDNKVWSMLLTMGLASCITVGLTYLRLIFDIIQFLLFLRIFSPTLLESSVVRQLTLRALVECEFEHCIFLKPVVELSAKLSYPGILVKSLILCHI
jgi:hypothetical protein